MKTVDEPPFDFLFHWSPSTRRKQIERRGLVPGSLSVDRRWRPPFVCLSPNPKLGLAMCVESADYGDRALSSGSWDLWVVDMAVLDGYELLFSDVDHGVKEVRVYERIVQRDVVYLATRLLD